MAICRPVASSLATLVPPSARGMRSLNASQLNTDTTIRLQITASPRTTAATRSVM